MAGTEDSSIWIGDLAFCSRKLMEQSPTRFQRYSLLFKFPGPSSPGSNLFCASRLSGEAPSNPTGSQGGGLTEPWVPATKSALALKERKNRSKRGAIKSRVGFENDSSRSRNQL